MILKQSRKTNLSLIILAERLDALAAQANARIHESDESVTVSNLRADAAIGLLTICSEIDWECSAFDEEQTPTEPCNICEDFEPFRLTIRKPNPTEATLNILTSVGVLNWLEKGHDAHLWRIAGLSKPLLTQLHVYTGWSPHEETFETAVSPATKSPRALVKESGSLGSVPKDIRQWLLLEKSEFDLDESFHKAWSAKSFNALTHALANQIDSADHTLIFKGPPKLVLQPPQLTAETIEEFGIDAFLDLQAAAHWVYESSREAEVKHSLLATEISRSGREICSATGYFKDNISTALESAKIAYQMSLSELGKDTLKSLADLRKSITEETAKATDSTRQTITAVSGALAVGVALVAARINTGINSWLISMVLLIAVGYIGMIIYSGWNFISLQRELRKDWQPKLYRFLPADEYQRMVETPAKKAERAFKITATIGMGAVILMSSSVLIFSFTSSTKAISSKSDHSELQINNASPVAPIQQSKKLLRPEILYSPRQALKESDLAAPNR